MSTRTAKNPRINYGEAENRGKKLKLKPRNSETKIIPTPQHLLNCVEKKRKTPDI